MEGFGAGRVFCIIRLLFASIILLLPGVVSAESFERKTLSLDGVWEILPDADDTGLQNNWQDGECEGIWKSIVVPSSWETVLGTDYDGIAWYRKRFAVPGFADGQRVLLRFHGCATYAQVWINGKKAGEHTGPWTLFTFDVTKEVIPQQTATIVVCLDEKVGHSTQGFLPIIAPHFGGIWQNVEMIITKTAWIDDNHISVDATEVDVEKKAGLLKASVPIRGEAAKGNKLRFSLIRGNNVKPGVSIIPVTGESVRWKWQGDIELWDINKPELYTLQIDLLNSDSEVIDSVSKRIGFRKVTADGSRILLNGKRIIVRGVLTWGYYPPLLAPAPDEELFRQQLRYFRSCGFNLIKFCLWLPPSEVLDIVDEEGMLCWVEYPTWHTRIDQTHCEELVREFTELSHHDGDHPSAILRSITCETGPSADLEVLREIYNLLKKRCPNTLVEDDSSWIGWNRIHDFWDDHSYGNNRTWRDKLRSLQKHIDENGIKPFLLGEAIFADTWIDTRKLLSESIDAGPWWLPRWLDDQLEFEKNLELRYGKVGYSPVADLKRASYKYAMDMRRWQMETFRQQMPDSGYVISTIRDVRICNMGLLDNFDRPKWSVDQWSFHGSSMTSLITKNDQRAFFGEKGRSFSFTPFHSNSTEPDSRNPSDVRWNLGMDALPQQNLSGSYGNTNGERINFRLNDSVQEPTQLSLRKESRSGGNYQKDAQWEFWALPEVDPVRDGLIIYGEDGGRELVELFPGAVQIKVGEDIPKSVKVVVTSAMSDKVMGYLDNGGRVLHLTSHLPGSFKTSGTWFGRGTVWSPPEPQAFFDDCPQEMLSYLQLFELGGNEVIRAEKLWDQVDPLVAFLETHDIDHVRENLLMFVTGVGKGRLAVSCLRHEGGADDNYAGLWLARKLASYLIDGPEPGRFLNQETFLALKTGLSAETKKVQGEWKFKKDQEGVGVEREWFKERFDDSTWMRLAARSAKEGEIWNSYDGWGWYRKNIEIPATWKGRTVRIVFDSVDDMYELYINGKKSGQYGKMDRSESSFLKRTWVDISGELEPGKVNQVTVRVYDWVGSGGLNGDVWMTTGPVEEGLDLLRR